MIKINKFKDRKKNKKDELISKKLIMNKILLSSNNSLIFITYS